MPMPNNAESYLRSLAHRFNEPDLREVADKIERLTAEVERYKAALREITGIGPSFDAKGTQSRRIDKIARRALDGEEVSDGD